MALSKWSRLWIVTRDHFPRTAVAAGSTVFESKRKEPELAFRVEPLGNLLKDEGEHFKRETLEQHQVLVVGAVGGKPTTCGVLAQHELAA